jgi:hypothetical protein
LFAVEYRKSIVTSVFQQQRLKQLRCGVSLPQRRHCHYSLLTFLCKGRQKPKNVDISPTQVSH